MEPNSPRDGESAMLEKVGTLYQLNMNCEQGGFKGGPGVLARCPTCYQSVSYRDRAVPLCLHSDGASVTQGLGSNAKSCLFLSFKSMVGGGVHKHFLMAAIGRSVWLKPGLWIRAKLCGTFSLSPLLR